jgi:hypothetical protein
MPAIRLYTELCACVKQADSFMRELGWIKLMTPGARMSNETIVLSISDNVCVDLHGVKLRSTNEVAQALEKIRSESPGATMLIEADNSLYYEAIGKAI